MKMLIWFTVFLFGVNYGISQQNDDVDSLKMALVSASSDVDVINLASKLGWLFLEKAKYDSARIYYRRALSLATSSDPASWRASMHLGIGMAYGNLNRFDSAIYNYKEAIVLFTTLKDSANLSTTYGNLSIVYKNQGLYEEALSSAISALDILERKAASLALASCYNNIGSISVKIGNFQDAVSYYRKSLSVRKKIDQPIEVARSYNNLGELFILTHQYDSAMSNLLRSMEIKTRFADKQGISRTLTNLGRVSMLAGDENSAKAQLLQSLDIQKQINDPIGMIETLNSLGELYLKTNNLPVSGKMLAEANAIIHRYGTPEYLRQNLELQVKLSHARKDFESGMLYLEELLTIRDSLLNQEKSKSLQGMQIRYETQKKEQEIALLQQREEVNQVRITNNRILIGALTAGLILVAAIGILVYLNLRNASAAKRRFELLLSETRHRIKNNLQTLASIFHLQTRHYTDHEMILEARSSESRVHAMSILHEKFYANDVNHIINTQDYITDLVNKLVDIYGSNTKNLNVSLEIESIDIDIDKAFALSLIIQELVCNAFKYAFDHQPNPRLSVDIATIGNHIRTTIQDNGVGFKRQVVTSEGLNLVDALVSQLNGTLQIEDQSGTTVVIEFPATSLWKEPAFS